MNSRDTYVISHLFRCAALLWFIFNFAWAESITFTAVFRRNRRAMSCHSSGFPMSPTRLPARRLTAVSRATESAIAAPSTGGPWSVGSFRQRDPKDYRGTMDYAKLIRTGHTHWYHPRFTEFIGRQNKLPWDAATLVALTAPRPLLNVNAVGDSINNGLAHEAGIRVGMLIYGWMGAGQWCRLHWRDRTNRFGQKGHDQGPEEFLAIFDFADEYFFGKPRGPSSFNAAPKSDTWRYDPEKFPLLIDWQVPAVKAD